MQKLNLSANKPMALSKIIQRAFKVKILINGKHPTITSVTTMKSLDTLDGIINFLINKKTKIR